MSWAAQLRTWTVTISMVWLAGGFLPHAAGQPARVSGGSTTLPAPTPVAPPAVGLDELIQVGLSQNPRLSRSAFAIDTARGRALQAGLYPNPTVSATLDELGDRTGPGGVNTLPLVSQEIVTGGKLKLNRAAATKEVDQATLNLMAQRYGLMGNIPLCVNIP